MNTLKRIFSLSNGALLVALTLSTIAAWYSIIGLTAIFSGAVMPIIIMGSALELAKITTTVWLRKYWHRCALIMKIYLVPAVVLLALLTSMGIFGFLSKAHLDQGIGSGDIAAKVQLLDEKIKVQKDNISSDRAMLSQMDQQVNDIMSKGDSERSVERSVAIRKQQAPERARILKDIEVSNTTIQKLNEERAPIASEFRKTEAEVGPIKYIAALIYGDQASQTMLESAVRWVIILLVVVFDPLAIMLVIAANQSKEWDKDDVEDDTMVPTTYTQEEIDILSNEFEEALAEPIKQDVSVLEVTDEEEEAFKELEPKPEQEQEQSILELHPYLNQPFVHFKELTPVVATSPHEDVMEVVELHDEEIPEIIDITPKKNDDTPPFEGIKDLETGEWVQTGPAYLDHPSIQGTMDSDYILYNGKRMSMEALQGLHPELFLKADQPKEPKVSFGSNFSVDAIKGDIFIRTDSIPNKVFKFNGNQWIETNREQTDAYLSNDEYLSFLVGKISTGEYDPEILTDQEQEAIRNHIQSK